jgi:hypothetical protein
MRMIRADHTVSRSRVVNVMGAVFVAGGVFEGALLLASIAFGWTLGPYKPSPVAFVALVLGGSLAAVATAALGRAMMRTYVTRFAVVDAPATTGALVIEARAALALILGIAAIVMIWPFGILIGPAAFWFGVSAVRRINGAPGRLAGGGRARAGVFMGAFVCGLYLFVVAAEVAATFMFGAPIPAAP